LEVPAAGPAAPVSGRECAVHIDAQAATAFVSGAGTREVLTPTHRMPRTSTAASVPHSSGSDGAFADT
jgi:hypothetical protein